MWTHLRLRYLRFKLRMLEHEIREARLDVETSASMHEHASMRAAVSWLANLLAERQHVQLSIQDLSPTCHLERAP